MVFSFTQPTGKRCIIVSSDVNKCALGMIFGAVRVAYVIAIERKLQDVHALKAVMLFDGEHVICD